MTAHDLPDNAFVGSVPEFYDRHMVPLIFEPYADDLVQRIRALGPTDVLEVAAGSGVVTRAMSAGLGSGVKITATDLNQPMLDHAKSVGTTRPVTWQQADVLDLPFPDDSFDVVVCQFGVMFFPDKVAAHAEVARVLRPGGTYVFSTWDRIENNEFVDVIEQALAELFPERPPTFMSRTPHGYFDDATIRGDLASSDGFGDATIDAVEALSRVPVAEQAARAYIEGTPLRSEINARDPDGLAAAIDASTRALTERFGAIDLVGKIRGFVVAATKAVAATTVELFADITCPFTHVGLKRVVEHVAELDHPVDVIVRAWPLEWVNGSALEISAVEVKAAALHDQLGVDDFSGLRHDRWPTTTLPALELAAAAYDVDAATGLAISLALRTALFEQGRDVGDPVVLAEIATEYGVAQCDKSDAVRADYDDGLARSVSGSPHFWVGETDFFCPALDLGHDAEDHLTARFDPHGLAQFFASIDA